jgi:serine/threonine protein kinase
LYPSAPRRTRRLASGDKLGSYEVIRQLAVGGMAEIYLARTFGLEGFEKLVVVKRILPQYGDNERFVEMFLNEARLAATLHHANIAQVYDIGMAEGDYFFAMEYVQGEDLENIAAAAEEQGVPLSMDVALTLVAGLCAGLHYAHEKAIVHRDVSPSNVLVSFDGAVKLTDFGIARPTSRQSATGSLKGKIAYMSPEQCRAKPLDRRSDLFSVGTILYELTAGRLPFSGPSEYQVLHQIANEDVPPPSEMITGYPHDLERIVLRALARDVDRRYATALELQADIEQFAHQARFRVSPLVLARLMGSLFPPPSDAGDDAPASKGYDDDGDEDTVIGAPIFAIPPERSSDTELPPPPDSTEEMTADEMLRRYVDEPAPVRHAPAGYPQMNSAMPGSLVSPGNSYATPPSSAVEPTLKVRRRKRMPTPTTFVRGTSATSLVVYIVAVIAAGVAAGLIALRW